MIQRLLRRDVLMGMVALSTFPVRATQAGTPKVHEVAIKAFEYVPDRITAQPGDIIRWINHDLAPHTASADDLSWDTGEIARGASADITVTQDMQTQYFCAFHPHMKGTITLE